MVDPRSLRRSNGFTHIAIVRGDERLTTGNIGPSKQICLVHGYARSLAKVLADGEVYDACEWCLTHSPLIEVDFANTAPGDQT